MAALNFPHKGAAMDLFDKCRNFTIAREAMAAGIYPYFTTLDDNSEGTEVVIRGPG
jgi:8-amino-7-oxononanoate synthase